MLNKALIILLLGLTPLLSYSANIVINPITGFSDGTEVDPIGGNPGETLGAQRLNTFQKAADILETFLDVKIDIKVDAAFSSLTCSAGSGILGSAGATSGKYNFSNAPLPNTIYPVALANNIALSDINSTTAEITATFNSDIDNNANCLNGVDWYYGYDDPTLAGADYINDTSFLSVVIHELLHGLGVSSWVLSNGSWNGGGALKDAYSINLYDEETNKSWDVMSNAERLASMTNTNDLVWAGSNVNSSTPALALTDGINTGKVEMYAPSPYEGGSSVSHFSKDATPNEIMEPTYTELLTTPGMATQLLQDIGWALASANTAPVLTAIGAQSSDEDNAKVINLSATDGEGDSLTYSAVSDNVSISPAVSGSTLTLTPDADYFGSANITVTVSDGLLSDSEIVVYSVNTVNDLPVFTSAASGSVQYGNILNVSLTATDVETANNSITFSVQSSDSNQVSASVSGSTLTLTPVNNYIGNSNITLRATDGNSGVKDQSYTLMISAIPNTAPLLSAIGAQSSDEDNAKVISLSATDAEGDSLIYSASSDNASVTATISDSTLTLTPNADYFGSANITVTVSDGLLSDSEIVVYSVNTVNDLPVFTSAASGSVQYGNSLNVSLTATDVETENNSITFSVQSSDSNQVSASVSGSTLTLTPVNNYVGNSNITLHATDGNGGVISQSFNLNITAVPNTAPVLTAIGAQSSDEDNAKVISLSATDAEGDSLIYSASSDNASVTATISDSTLTLTPNADYFGSANITVSVSDSVLSDSEVVAYSINTVNDLPVFTSGDSGSVHYGNSLNVSLTATDVETANNSISFSVQSSDSNQVSASISGSTLTLTPVNSYIGNSNITLRATDGNSGVKDQSYTLTISAIPNTAPVLTAIGTQSSDEDNAKVISLSATDGEGDSLTYSASSDNTSVTAAVSGSTLTLTPDANYFGNANITVSVSDSVLSDSEVVAYSINTVNDLPVFTSGDSGSVHYGNSLNVSLTATDVETANNSISFSVQSSDSNQVSASVSGSTLTLTPVNSYVGNSNITLRATDGNSGVKDQSYTLTISAIPNTAPVLTAIGTQSSDEDNAKVISLSAADGEGDSLTYSASSDNASVTAAISGSTLTLTPATDYFGNANITVSVSDSVLSDSEVVVYTVNSVNDLPVFTSAASGSVQYSNSLSVNLTATDVETANTSITFSVQSSDSNQVSASVSGSTLTLTPVNSYVGNSNITLRATDGNGGVIDQSYVLTITEAENTAPYFSGDSSFTTLYSSPLNIDLSANDDENDPLTFNLVSFNNEQLNVSLNGPALNVLSINGYLGSSTIVVSVSDGEETITQQIEIQILEDFSLSSSSPDLGDGQTAEIALDTFSFSLAGGNNSHTVSIMFNGQDVKSSLLTESNGNYQLAMPTDGAFAGRYEINVTDSNGEAANFTLERPLRLFSNINQLVSSSEQQELYIEGAPSGSIIDLHISQANNDLSLQQNNQIISQIESPDNASQFNRATVQLMLLESTTASVATLSADAVNLPLGSHSLELIPLKSVSFSIIDNALSPVPANILINDERFISWGLTQQYASNEDGEISVSVPADQATSFTVSAQNYQDVEVTVDTEISRAEVELVLLENPLTVSGKVTTTTLNFVNETPIVQLIASDGSVVQAGLTNISSTSVNYSITVNKFAFSAEQLSIRHGNINQNINLSSTTNDSTINIQIDQLQQVNTGNNENNEPSEEIVEVDPAATGNGFALVTTALILLLRRKKRVY